MFEEFTNLIEKHDSIIIFGHKNPDGDCYGSAVALKRSLSLKYPQKNIYITGTGLPDFFDLLMPVDIVPDDIFPTSLAILVDANDLARMEDSRIYNCKAFMKFDHHVDTGSFNEGPQYVEEDANSTCDIIYKYILESNCPIDEIVANALYLGILTDSGRFQFVIDYPQTFETVGNLCKHGANPKAINSLLLLVNEESLHAKGYVYTHYKRSPHGVMYIIFTKEELERIGMDTNSASNLINLLGNIRDCPIWLSFAEYPDGGVRVEIRSNGPEVQPYARQIGGGGHMYAAGAFMSTISIKEVEKVVNDLDQIAWDYKKQLKKRR